MPLKTPSGRVYVFYTYNKDNLREVAGSNSRGTARRVDTLGAYCFKFSDDNGRTWSQERYEIPARLMRIDRENLYGGKVLYFWGVGKPIIHKTSVYFGFAKVGKWGNPRHDGAVARLLHAQRQHSQGARPPQDPLGIAARWRRRPARAQGTCLR